MSCPATIGSAASAGTAVNDPPSSARSSSSAPRSRATPTTCAPALLRAAAMPLPKPRLAPVTSAVAPASSSLDMTILPGLVGSAPSCVAAYRYRPARFPWNRRGVLRWRLHGRGRIVVVRQAEHGEQFGVEE